MLGLIIYIAALLIFAVFSMVKFMAFCRLVAKDEGREDEFLNSRADDGGGTEFSHEITYRLFVRDFSANLAREAKIQQRLLFLNLAGIVGLIIFISHEVA